MNGKKKIDSFSIHPRHCKQCFHCKLTFYLVLIKLKIAQYAIQILNNPWGMCSRNYYISNENLHCYDKNDSLLLFYKPVLHWLLSLQ